LTSVSSPVPAAVAIAPADSGEPGTKGLKTGALGFVSNVVIGVASTAPGYSLAVSLGLVAAAVGFQAPAIMLVAFIPMLFIAAAYYYLNRADPDCGTTFSWVTRAMGPVTGWLGGWAIIVADIIVMASLADIASTYTFDLFGLDQAALTVGVGDVTISIPVLLGGILWIAVMTWICYIGIEVSARTQVILLSAELVTLGLFSVIALARVYAGTAGANAATPSIDWVNPFLITDTSALAAGMLVALFIYWGWDTTVSVNEESRDATETPGRAAIVATVILLLTYVLVSVAAQAFNGADSLAQVGGSDVLAQLGNSVMGSPLDKLLIIAVLTSAAASTQTTILPSARTSLSMAAKGALPSYWGRISPKYLTPSTSTVWFGVVSIAWYVGLKILSDNVLSDATTALGLMIAFYYGLTGVACVIFYRHLLLRSVRNFVFIGVLPAIGAVILFLALIKSIIDDSDPANTDTGTSLFGLGLPVAVALVFTVLGLVLLVAQRIREPAFFHRKRETYNEALHSPGGPAVEGS
jgi:amino acid transporter